MGARCATRERRNTVHLQNNKETAGEGYNDFCRRHAKRLTGLALFGDGTQQMAQFRFHIFGLADGVSHFLPQQHAEAPTSPV